MPASDIIAIDILLEPDDRMLAHAERNNERLRAVFPAGFALDTEHRPHITLLQCFIAAKDLDALSTAADAIIRAAKVTDIQLRADRFYYAPGPGTGIAGICAPPRHRRCTGFRPTSSPPQRPSW